MPFQLETYKQFVLALKEAGIQDPVLSRIINSQDRDKLLEGTRLVRGYYNLLPSESDYETIQNDGQLVQVFKEHARIEIIHAIAALCVNALECKDYPAVCNLETAIRCLTKSVEMRAMKKSVFDTLLPLIDELKKSLYQPGH